MSLSNANTILHLLKLVRDRFLPNCSLRDCGYPVGNNVSLLYTYLLFISLAINPQWMYDYFPTADSQFVSVTIVSFWFVSLFIYLLIIFFFYFQEMLFPSKEICSGHAHLLIKQQALHHNSINHRPTIFSGPADHTTILWSPKLNALFH